MQSVRFLQVAVLLLVLIVSLVAAAPARLLTYLVPQEPVSLQGLSGTVWEGKASRVMVKIPAGFVHLGAVQWALLPGSLLALSPALQLRSVWGSQRVSGQVTLRGEGAYTLEGVEARVAADLLRQFAPLALGGHFDVLLSAMEIEDNLPHSGSGRLVWERASWQAPRGAIALGTYALDFAQSPGEPLRGTVVTVAGPLEAAGRVELNGRRYLIDITVRSDEPLDRQLTEALSLMAAPEGDGYRLKLEGDF